MVAVPGSWWGDFQRVPPTFPNAGKIGGIDETSTLLLQISSSSLEPSTLHFPTQSEIRSPVWKCESCKVETYSTECHDQRSILGEDFAEVPIFLANPPSVERKPREEKRGDPGKTSVAPSTKVQPRTPEPQTGTPKYAKFPKPKGDLPKIVLNVNEGPRRTNFQLKLKEVEVKPKFSPHQARKKVPGEAGGTRPPGMS